MDLFIKKYKNLFHFTSDTVLLQHPITQSLSISEEINNYNIAKFSIPTFVDIVSDDIIEVVDATKNDKVIFRGYVYEKKKVITSNWSVAEGFADLIVYSEKAVLQRRRRLGDDITYTAKTVGYILNELLNEWNDLWESWLLQVEDEQTLDIQVKQWDDIYSVLEEMCAQLWLFRDVNFGNIKVSAILGSDYSNGGVGRELYYNGDHTNANNVESFIEIDQARKYSIVIWSDQEGNKVTEPSSFAGLIGENIYWVLYETFRNWDLTAKTLKKYQDVTNRKPVYEFNVENNTLSANVWDIVKIHIENVDKKTDGIGASTIIKKRVVYNDWVLDVNYTIGEANAEIVDDSVFFKKLYSEVKKKSL